MIVIVMGVSGVGKSAVGQPLAQKLGAVFLDADDFHPPENVAKMRQGIALSDADRWPWLDALNRELRALESAQRSAVLACSALKQAYRDRLTGGLTHAEFVWLHGDFDMIEQRLKARAEHYMPATLLRSQFAALEPPRDAIEINIDHDVDEIVQRALRKLSVRSGGR